MPRAGGAIQFANFPGSTTRPMVCREPRDGLTLPVLFRENLSVWTDVGTGETADLAMESHVWQFDAEWESEFFRDAIPSIQAGLHFARKVVAQPGIQSRQRWGLLIHDASVCDFRNEVHVT